MEPKATLVKRLQEVTWSSNEGEIARSSAQALNLRPNMMTQAAVIQKRVGLSYWMQEVADQCEKVLRDFSSDPVHDLRTALRRCRSIADGVMIFDRHPSWKKMKRAAKEVFSSLGELRDAQVMKQWIEELAAESDTAAKILGDFVVEREQAVKKTAAETLLHFDCKQWKTWATELPSRAARIPAEGPVLAQLALERWQEARDLHHRALRNRTKTSFHDLRIGTKRLRYTVENFLPSLHEAWGQDLKDVQDLLGEVHDLDVLWQTALKIKAFPDAESKAWWRSRIEQERAQRVEAYRGKMVGSNSLWPVWRAALPQPHELRSLALERLRIWASLLDPSAAHARHVADLALQLYDGMPEDGILRGSRRETYRAILRAAALMHDVGRSRTKVGHHKASGRLIRKLIPPLGWTADEIRIAALVARYHRGALPKETQKRFAALPQSKQQLVSLLAGLLRLACACDQQHNREIRRVEVEETNPVLTIRAEGYAEYTAKAENLAAARHLLELACHRAVLILPSGTAAQARAA
jgi:CHAD domain-containing protein/HD superfamily phosphodiesterase